MKKNELCYLSITDAASGHPRKDGIRVAIKDSYASLTHTNRRPSGTETTNL